MTSFGWKRKIGERVEKAVSVAFNKDAAEDEDADVTSGQIDWLNPAPKRRLHELEDGVIKSRRLRQEGIILAEEDRHWEALKKWEEALQLSIHDESIYEMQAQSYMAVGEVFPAVAAAKKAVFLNCRWWVAHQTLGRALLGMGEVTAAVRSFAKAIHVHPVNEELWEEDLRWAHSLSARRRALQREKLEQKAAKRAKIVELDDDGGCSTVAKSDYTINDSSVMTGSSAPTRLKVENNKLPANYVCMRE